MKKPVTKVELLHNRATLTVNGHPIGPMAFTPSGTNMGITPEVAQNLAKSGINVFFVTFDSGWRRKDTWQNSIHEVENILTANPNAWIIVRVECVAPESWINQNPDELNTFEDGRKDHYENASTVFDHRCVCLASDQYAEESARHVGRLIDHLDQNNITDRIIGYFLLGMPAEWCYKSCYDGSTHCLGFSPAFRKRYSQWLENKYSNEETLREAWKDASASFAKPHIPSLAERCFNPPRIPATANPAEHDKLSRQNWCGYPFEQRLTFKADWGSFLDPAQSQCTLDYFEAYTAATAGTIDFIAKAIKEKTNNKTVVGAFYGILASNYPHAHSTAGPQMLQDSENIDFLSAPSTYEDRVPGGGATFRTPVDSFSYRGKLWFNETDSRTWRVRHNDLVNFGGVYNCKDSLEVLKRDFAQAICDDVNAWWFDQGIGAESYYDDPAIYELFKKQQEIACDYYAGPRKKTSEIAIVYDQDSIWPSDPETLRDIALYNRILEIPRMGAPCDHIFLRDLALSNLPDYKMYVFVNCFAIDQKKRKLIQEVVKCDNKTAVWLYAQGLIDPNAAKQLSLDNMEKLTGIGFDYEHGPREGTFRIENNCHNLTATLSPYANYGTYTRPILNNFGWHKGKITIIQPSFLDPVISVRDEQAIPLGRFITNDKPAYAIKEMNNWKSVFIGSKVMNAPIMRSIAQNANVHIYLDTNDIVYANQNFVTVHASTEGLKNIHLPSSCSELIDAYTAKRYEPDENNVLSLTMDAGTTAMLKIL